MEKSSKKDEKKIIKWYEMIFIGVVLIIFLVICVHVFGGKVDYHCKKAVCNSDNTICSTYAIDAEGETVKTWQGSCAKKSGNTKALVISGVFSILIVGVTVVYIVHVNSKTKKPKLEKNS